MRNIIIFITFIFVFFSSCSKEPPLAQTVNESLAINELITTVNYGFISINNILVPVDTIVAQVKNGGTPLYGRAVQFTLGEGTPGYIYPNVIFTDSLGMGSSIYRVEAQELELTEADTTITVVINVSAADDLDGLSNPSKQKQIEYTSTIGNAENSEYNVQFFNFYPNNNNIINFAGETNEISVIAKDISGISVCNVDVRFELIGNNGVNYVSPYGVIDKPNAITCDNDSLANFGIATVNYLNIDGGTDLLIAKIQDPQDDTQTLKQDTINIQTFNSSQLIDDVQSISGWPAISNLVISSIDSLIRDTIFAIALDENGVLMPGIPFQFQFSESNQIQEPGYLTNGSAMTDSSGIAYTIYYPNTSIFYNNNINELDELNVPINISIPSTDLSSDIDVRILNNIPDWYPGGAILSLSSNANILPDSTTNDYFTTITATLIDTLLNLCPDGTVIEFESIKKDSIEVDGQYEPIWSTAGNINPAAIFENGHAEATFNMADDRGVAYIVGKTLGNISDTIQIVMQNVTATHIEIEPAEVDQIMVQGGGGVEYSEIIINATDDYGNIVADKEYIVLATITQPSPQGVSFGEDGQEIQYSQQEILKSTYFGVTSVTINSGSRPGSVHMTVSLFDIEDINLENPIAIAESTPLVIVTGPAEYGEINFSNAEIEPIGGGLYQFPVSIYLEDLHSNPIADSTAVYFKLRETAATYFDTIEYSFNELVTWLSPDSIFTTVMDSLVYECVDDLFGCPEGIDPSNSLSWALKPYPGEIIGQAETGMAAPDGVAGAGEGFPGIAWSMIYYSTTSVAKQLNVFAQTYSTDNSLFIIDSRENHNNDPIVLPCYNCTVGLFALPTTWDFSLFPFDADCPEGGGFNCNADFQDVSVQATVTDFYQFPVTNALLALQAPGANFTFVCNGEDTDQDGFTGHCINALDITDTLSISNCLDCPTPDYTWVIEDTDANDVIDTDGTPILVPDDIANYSRTGGNGEALWSIRYNEAVNIAQGEDPVTYQTFQSQIEVFLLTPNNGYTATPITITIDKTEED